mmetsp:Transcript_4570/g.6881  ORF Transcript_4570/g.6881 Transcript_4570/m.6881 type:complete len:275 (-) Transcript_4570:91-915(-)
MTPFEKELDCYAKKAVCRSQNSEYMDRRALNRSKLSEAVFRETNKNMMQTSRAIYVGNLSLWTQEAQIWKYFNSFFDGVEDIIMGVNRTDKTAAGFCFVVFQSSDAALSALRLLQSQEKQLKLDAHKSHHQCGVRAKSKSAEKRERDFEIESDSSSYSVPGSDFFIIDERVLRADLDRGGDIRAEGRYWGRGYSGGQVRDEYRQTVDMGRGGPNARKFWEAKKWNLFIPSLSHGDQTETSSRIDVDGKEYWERGENLRHVYDWLSFDVKQWKCA